MSERDVKGAEAILAPLDTTQFEPPELAFYAYVQGIISTRKGDYDQAQHMLETSLQIEPDYEPAQDLLEHVKGVIRLLTSRESFMEKQRKRDQSKRSQMQSKLSAIDPSLSEALTLYTKGMLTGMARVVIREGGWHGLRKAELLQRIITELNDRDNLEYIVVDLDDDEHDALQQVLASGGSMAWQDFDARYGNDLDEASHWEYHQPKTVMGRLRLRGLLAEAIVDKELLIVMPVELRQVLGEILADSN